MTSRDITPRQAVLGLESGHPFTRSQLTMTFDKAAAKTAGMRLIVG